MGKDWVIDHNTFATATQANGQIILGSNRLVADIMTNNIFYNHDVRPSRPVSKMDWDRIKLHRLEQLTTSAHDNTGLKIAAGANITDTRVGFEELAK